MKTRLGTKAWNDLGLEQYPERMELVRASFYLGYNLPRVARNVSVSLDSRENRNIIDTAYILGMNDHDVVEFDIKYFP